VQLPSKSHLCRRGREFDGPRKYNTFTHDVLGLPSPNHFHLGEFCHVPHCLGAGASRHPGYR
jgi:hypothetical protein